MGEPIHLVVMGVSGSGKSAVGRPLARRLGLEFAEGDDFHPAANVGKMAAGRPLTDDDRLPWLHRLAEWTRDNDRAGRSTLVTCSALKRAYRDVLREALPRTWFVHLHGDKGLILQRMGTREHFFPPELLESQLDTLEPLGRDEQGFVVDVAAPVARLVGYVVDRLRAELPGDASDPVD